MTFSSWRIAVAVLATVGIGGTALAAPLEPAPPTSSKGVFVKEDPCATFIRFFDFTGTTYDCDLAVTLRGPITKVEPLERGFAVQMTNSSDKRSWTINVAHDFAS